MYFNLTRRNIRELQTEYSEGILDLEPDYQRGYIWSLNQKHLLIDSLFEGFPIPNLFFLQQKPPFNSKKANSKKVELASITSFYWEVFDGKQRLTTILDFLNDLFPYKNQLYSQLSMSQQRLFQRIGLQICEIYQPITPAQLTSLFHRINCGGTQWQPNF
jgi:uncharacterized protein with ParB-like and HNH nuclease domain